MTTPNNMPKNSAPLTSTFKIPTTPTSLSRINQQPHMHPYTDHRSAARTAPQRPDVQPSAPSAQRTITNSTTKRHGAHWELITTRPTSRKVAAGNPFLRFLHLGKVFNISHLSALISRTSEAEQNRLIKLNPPAQHILELAQVCHLNPFLTTAVVSTSAVNSRKNRLELALHELNHNDKALDESLLMVKLPATMDRAAVEPHIGPRNMIAIENSYLDYAYPTERDVHTALLEEAENRDPHVNNALLPFRAESGESVTTALTAPNKALLQSQQQLRHLPRLTTVDQWLTTFGALQRVHRSLAVSAMPAHILDEHYRDLPGVIKRDLHNTADPEDLLPETMIDWLDCVYEVYEYSDHVADPTNHIIDVSHCPVLDEDCVTNHRHAKAIGVITMCALIDIIIQRIIDAHAHKNTTNALITPAEFTSQLNSSLLLLSTQLRELRPSSKDTDDRGVLSAMATVAHEYATAIHHGLIYPIELMPAL